MSCKNLKFNTLQYVLNTPDHFDEKAKYPIIIFLHGAGSRSENVNELLNNQFFKETEKYNEFPFIIAAPLCHTDTWFDMFTQIIEFTEYISNEPYADKRRIYGIGASMGGYGIWQLAMSRPDIFAAIIPVCGGGMYWNAGRLKDVAVWAFHGAKDPTVFCEESKKMVDAVNRCGGNAKLSIYPENAHNAWTDTYSNYDVYKWLLEHKKEDTKLPEKDEKMFNSVKFG